MITKTKFMKKTILLTCFSLALLVVTAQQNSTSSTNVKQATPVVKVDNKPLKNSNKTTGEIKTCCQKGAEQSKGCSYDKRNAKDCKKNTKSCNHVPESKE